MLSSGTKKSSKGCWTCKDRKVRCDGGQPSCANCARVRKTCQGYGMRLSWPKDGDTRRLIVGNPPVSLARPPKGSDIQVVHTSYFDIDMYSFLAGLRSSSKTGDCNKVITYPLQLVLPAPETWKTGADLDTEEVELIDHFETDAHTILAPAMPDTSPLRDILLRMALTDHSITSRAVLHAILALSSLQRDGLHLQAAQHKTAAVGALAASAKNGIDNLTDAARHVAANMLLCTFEIYVGTDSHGHWPWYLIGAREIIRAANLQTMLDREDICQLVMWVFNYDVHARLSLFHWKRKNAAGALGIQMEGRSWQRELCAIAAQLELEVPNLPQILRYLADAVDTLCLSFRCSPSELQQLRDDMHGYEQKILAVPELMVPPPHMPTSKNNNPTPSIEIMTELFRITALVYIARVCEAQFGEMRDLSWLLDKAFALIRVVPTCERLLPLFIIGCEARTDEHRMAVLDLIRRTEANTRVRSLACFRRGLDSVWIQDDLHADQDMTLDYLNKLSVIISSSPTLPNFV